MHQPNLMHLLTNCSFPLSHNVLMNDVPFVPLLLIHFSNLHTASRDGLIGPNKLSIPSTSTTSSAFAMQFSKPDLASRVKMSILKNKYHIFLIFIINILKFWTEGCHQKVGFLIQYLKLLQINFLNWIISATVCFCPLILPHSSSSSTFLMSSGFS